MASVSRTTTLVGTATTSMLAAAPMSGVAAALGAGWMGWWGWGLLWGLLEGFLLVCERLVDV